MAITNTCTVIAQEQGESEEIIDYNVTYDSIVEKTDLLCQYWAMGDIESATEVALELDRDIKAMPPEVEQKFYEEMDKPENVRKKRSASGTIGIIFTVVGAGYKGAYAVGQWCRNHNWDYWAGQAALFVASAYSIPAVKISLAFGYDNGWNSVK